jgi:hypothetical protein
MPNRDGGRLLLHSSRLLPWSLHSSSVDALVFLSVVTILCNALEVPCVSDNALSVASHAVLTLTGCDLPSRAPFVPIHLTSDSAGVLTNVTVLVVGGSVLPRLIPNGTTLTELSHVTVSITGARVGPYATSCSVNCSTTLRHSMSIVSASCEGLSRRCIVHNVVIYIVNTSVDIAVTLVAVVPAPLGSLLLSIDSSNGQQRSSIAASSIAVRAEECDISLSIDGTAAVDNIGIVGFTLRDDSVADNIDIQVTNCVVKLAVNFSAAKNVITGRAALFRFAGAYLTSNLTFDGVAVCIRGGRSVIAASALLPGYPDHPGTFSRTVYSATLTTFVYASRVHNATILLEAGTQVALSCECSRNCAVAPQGQQSFFTASAVFFDDGVNSFIYDATSISVVASGVAFAVTSPYQAVVVMLINVNTLQHVHTAITNCTVSMEARGLDCEARRSTVVYFTSRAPRDMRVAVADTSVSVSSEHGGAPIVFECVVDISNASHTVVGLHRVTMTAVGRPGSAQILANIAVMLYMVSSLFVVAANDASHVNTNLSVAVVNCSIQALQYCNLPATMVGVPYASLACSLSAVFAIQSMMTSTIVLSGVHVLRLAPEQLPLGASAVTSFVNATSLLLLSDMRLVVNSNPEFQSILSLVRRLGHELLNTVRVTISDANITASSNCTVSYANPLTQISTDVVALLNLPPTSTSSSYAISDACIGGPTVCVGSIVSAVGTEDMSNTTVAIRSVRNMNSLLTTRFATLVLSYSSTMVFADVAVTAAAGQLMYAVAQIDGGRIDFSQNSTASHLMIAGCVFAGLQQLLFPGSVNATAVNVTSGAKQVVLGCNLWDGRPLLTTDIQPNTTDLELRRFVDYPPSLFLDQSVHCDGFAQAVADKLYGATVASAVTAVTYVTTVVSSGGAGLVPLSGLQQSMAALGLAARCLQSPNGARTGDPPPFNSPLDNALLLRLPVGADELAYAAGAPLGNALLAVAVGVLLSLLLRAKRRMLAAATQSVIAARTAALVPCAALPGSIAGTYGRFLQPSVAACVTLLFAGAGDARSAACGALMLAVWAAYPAYCVHAVLWRGRTGPPHGQRAFVLRGRNTAVHQRRASQSHSCRGAITAVIDDAQRPVQAWAPRKRGVGVNGAADLAHAQLLLSTMESVFGGYVEGREWYFVAEWGVSVASGAVLGAAQVMAMYAGGASVCAAADVAAWAATAFTALQVALCVWLRPHSVRLELATAVLFGCVELLANVLLVAGDVDAAEAAVTTSAILELLLTVLFVLLDAARRWTVHGVGRNAPALDVVAADQSKKPRRPRPERKVKAMTASQSEQLQILVQMVCTYRR